jgi:type IV secretion system protein VirD4
MFLIRFPLPAVSSLLLSHWFSSRFHLLLAAGAALGLVAWWWLGKDVGVGRRRWQANGRSASSGARWAKGAELSRLRVSRPGGGRIIVGRHRRRLIGLERCHSLLVVGPTQTSKTVGLAVPAILEWEGPVVAASVKTDLATVSWRHRQHLGQVFFFDPTHSTPFPADSWSPLQSVVDWSGARRIAKALCDGARPMREGVGDSDFWFAAAARALAPLLLAASCAEGGMGQVLEWVETEEYDDPEQILITSGASEATRTLRSLLAKDHRFVSSVWATAEVILAAFRDEPCSLGRRRIDPKALVRSRSDTLFICAPPYEQARLRPVFSALLSEVFFEAFNLASRTGKPLDPPMLVVLDEAANIAQLEELDTVASTSSGQGIALVSVWQDLAQIQARYGPRWATILNNHRAKLVLGGISDPSTLEHVARVTGEAQIDVVSRTHDKGGRFAATWGPAWRSLIAPADLRTMPNGCGVLVYGGLPPAMVRLRPWFKEKRLARLVARSQQPSNQTDNW